MKNKKQVYVELLKDPRWQKKRLEIMNRDNFTYQHCGSTDESLQVHHLWYSLLKNPWEYNDESLITLCEHCHELETEYNSELYSSFCDLKTIAGQSGFSKQVLESIFVRICTFLTTNQDECKDEFVSDLFYDAICGTQLYSDAKSLEKKGIDMSEYFKNVKTKNLNA